PDFSFSFDGLVMTDFHNHGEDDAAAVAVVSDGKILVAGTTTGGGLGLSGFAIVRYNSDGSLDHTFGDMGKVYYPRGNGKGGEPGFPYGIDVATSLTILPGDVFVVGGKWWDGALASRFQADGTPERTMYASLKDAVFTAQPDEKFVLAVGKGPDVSVSRFMP